MSGLLCNKAVGTASIQDVVISLTVLSNARSRQILTYSQWAASLANLAFSSGVLEDDSGEWTDNRPKSPCKLKYNGDKALENRNK